MVATLPCVGAVNQVTCMFAAKESGSHGYSQYEITYLLHGKGSGSLTQDCYMVCVPLHLIHAMKDYLNRYSCKFSGQYSIDRNRAEFFVEEFGHPKLLSALVDRTKANGGKVDIGNVQWNVVNRKDNQYLNITFRGQCIQDMCCKSADDYDNMIAFEDTFTENDLLDIRAAIFTAIERSTGTLTVGYDTRICLDIAELFMEYGFVSVPEDECLVLKR